MRYVIVDYARQQGAQKRGGDIAHVTLNQVVLKGEEKAQDILALEDSLERLERKNKRLAQLAILWTVFDSLDAWFEKTGFA